LDLVCGQPSLRRDFSRLLTEERIRAPGEDIGVRKPSVVPSRLQTPNGRVPALRHHIIGLIIGLGMWGIEEQFAVALLRLRCRHAGCAEVDQRLGKVATLERGGHRFGQWRGGGMALGPLHQGRRHRETHAKPLVWSALSATT